MLLPRSRIFWAVGLGHLTTDMFTSMGPVLLAFLSATLVPMTKTEIGFAASTASLVGALCQPFFGIVVDRTGGRWIGALGVAWSVGVLLVALVVAHTGQYWLMFLPFVLPALGNGAFHPVGALYAAESEPERTARNLSVFFLLGQTGLALGPALAGLLLDAANPDRTPFPTLDSILPPAPLTGANLLPIFILALAALPSVALMAFTIPNRQSHRAAHPRPAEASSSRTPIPWRSFAVLGSVVALRSLAQPGSVTFIPVLFHDKGWNPAEYGLITGSFWIASGIAGVLFGHLADRFDRRYIIAISLLLSAPALFLLPLSNGALAFVLAMAAGGLSGGSHSIIVLFAQELIPASRGFASGAILGFIFGTGALASLVIGGLADLLTLGMTFQIVAGIVVIAGLFSLALPARKLPAAVELTDGAEVELAATGS